MASISNGIGGYISAKRRAAGLTLAEAADLSGVAASTISRLERGAMLPTVPTLISLSEALGMDLFDLLAKMGSKAKRELPAFEDYLRQKYHLTDDSIGRMVVYFRAEVSDKSTN
ncbi:helix-turn-helix domain-containing protein [Amycolatopsis sp. H20-H5]|uniref:helix-turn-helix domain-containing protein n=1 Tax=Amycolatopsis sp. H20-H5 TaxID=3046309 RepID=UPI002DBB46FA|nr:helix-turn-helix transcriptional regulator [Amycolatopsis sp. H20-H5]MEC3980401.1 helix-turn-helix transcriptional regulator [Amycolatopsis sp. H20-H5]